MKRRSKVELFEQIRREHEFGGRFIRALASHLGVHRRTVRQHPAPPDTPRIRAMPSRLARLNHA